jgi:hypothetical protein
MKVLPTRKKPSFHRVTSASLASSERTARAKSNPSDDEPTKSAGLAIELVTSAPCVFARDKIIE